MEIVIHYHIGKLKSLVILMVFWEKPIYHERFEI